MVKSQGIPPIVSAAEFIARSKERECRSSEARFDAIFSWGHVHAIRKATVEFQKNNALEVVHAKCSEQIPDIPNQVVFKYSSHGQAGELAQAAYRLAHGEDLSVVLVLEDDKLIGYGIASHENDRSEIKIIDVDQYSRREACLFADICIAGEVFHVGVGHIVAYELVCDCRRQIVVDATHDKSRYIFKSLGFIHDSSSGNPCILMMGRDEIL